MNNNSLTLSGEAVILSAMDSITVDGTVYTKASILAKRFKYTSDYVGQLCRAKKVECQIVGRTWYVHESSLLNHKNDRYRSLRSNEIISKISSNFVSGHDEPATARSVVRPSLSKKTFRSVTAVVPVDVSQKVKISYEPDSFDLIPQAPVKVLPPKIVPNIPDSVDVNQKIDVSLSDSVAVAVNSTVSGPQKLDFTEMPEVALQGTVRVVSVPDAVYEKGDLDLPVEEKVESEPHFLKRVSAAEKRQVYTPQSVRAEKPADPVSVRLVFASVLLGLLLSLCIVSIDSYTVSSRASSYTGIVFNVDTVRSILP